MSSNSPDVPFSDSKATQQECYSCLGKPDLGNLLLDTNHIQNSSIILNGKYSIVLVLIPEISTIYWLSLDDILPGSHKGYLAVIQNQ